MTEPTPDSNAQARKEWSAGSYPTVGRSFMGIAARLVDAVEVGPDDSVLDVACGTGNVALTAHRRGAAVTGVDITPEMLELARERAAVFDATIDWREGDAAALPVEDDAFDVTLSCLGHMFAADPAATGAELVRATRPGGRIAFTSWTPTCGIAAMMKALVAHLPPDPVPSPPPFLWGDPDAVRERLGDRVTDLRFETGTVRYPALSPAHFWRHMTVDSGPVLVALEATEEAAMPAIREDVVAAIEPFFSEDENAVQLEYRLVTATVR